MSDADITPLDKPTMLDVNKPFVVGLYLVADRVQTLADAIKDIARAVQMSPVPFSEATREKVYELIKEGGSEQVALAEAHLKGA